MWAIFIDCFPCPYVVKRRVAAAFAKSRHNAFLTDCCEQIFDRIDLGIFLHVCVSRKCHRNENAKNGYNND